MAALDAKAATGLTLVERQELTRLLDLDPEEGAATDARLRHLLERATPDHLMMLAAARQTRAALKRRGFHQGRGTGRGRLFVPFGLGLLLLALALALQSLQS